MAARRRLGREAAAVGDAVEGQTPRRRPVVLGELGGAARQRRPRRLVVVVVVERHLHVVRAVVHRRFGQRAHLKENKRTKGYAPIVPLPKETYGQGRHRQQHLFQTPFQGTGLFPRVPGTDRP